jgi:tetratricopeptide (TPR) repeat protein
MLKKLFLILIVIILGTAGEASAQRRSPSKSADIAFERKQYNVAIERYKKAYKKSGKKKNEDERTHITYRLAECYRITEATKQAESHYKRLLKTEYPKKYPIIYFYYAEVLKRNKKYEDAAANYAIYNELMPDDYRCTAALKDLANIQIWLETPTKYDSGNPVSLMGTLFEQTLLLYCDQVVLHLNEVPGDMLLRHANLE